MIERMPCRISDGPQTPEDVLGYEEVDEDALYEEWKSWVIDNQREDKENSPHE